MKKFAAVRITTVAVMGMGALALPVSAASAARPHHAKHHATRKQVMAHIAVPMMAHIAMPPGAGPR